MFRQHLLLTIAPDARIDVETDPLRAMQLSPQQYDLILLDTVIGNMDGFQLMSVMKKQASKARFIVVSEQANELYRFQAYHNGADLFLMRPGDDAAWEDAMVQIGQLTEPSHGAVNGTTLTLAEQVKAACTPGNAVIMQVDIIGNSADIFIHDGEVYHAQCPGWSGEKAFRRIMTWPKEEMRVQVHPLNHRPPRTIERSLEQLLSAEPDETQIPWDTVLSVTALESTKPIQMPEEMAMVEAPPFDTSKLPEPEIKDPRVKSEEAKNGFKSEALAANWKIDLMGKFMEGSGDIDPEHTAALTYFIYRKMADVAVALDEDYFDHMTLIGPEYRQELVADNLCVRHALFDNTKIAPQEPEAYVKWCYGQSV